MGPCQLVADKFAAVEDDLAAGFGFFATVGAIDEELAAGHPAVAIGERNLIGVGGGAARGILDGNAIGADFGNFDRGEVAIDVGREVVLGIANFIDELLDNS